VLQESQVAGRRNGEKLGDALDTSKQDGSEGLHEAEIYHSSPRGATRFTRKVGRGV